jgi:hypothetical protein
MARNAVASGASILKPPAGKGLPEGAVQELISAAPGIKRLMIQARERASDSTTAWSALTSDRPLPTELRARGLLLMQAEQLCGYIQCRVKVVSALTPRPMEHATPVPSVSPPALRGPPTRPDRTRTIGTRLDRDAWTDEPRFRLCDGRAALVGRAAGRESDDHAHGFALK